MDNGQAPAPVQEPSTDEALLRRFADGDRCALEELARRYEAPLLGLARGLLGGRDDLACDAVQETWLRIIRYARSFRGRSTPRTWIYRIVINQCHNIRAKGRRSSHQTTSALHAEPAAHSAPEPTTQSEDRERLRREVAQLSEDRRLILLLCYHDGLTHQQAAEVLDIPVGTLKSRLHAALTELRQRLPSEVRT